MVTLLTLFFSKSSWIRPRGPPSAPKKKNLRLSNLTGDSRWSTHPASMVAERGSVGIPTIATGGNEGETENERRLIARIKVLEAELQKNSIKIPSQEQPKALGDSQFISATVSDLSES